MPEIAIADTSALIALEKINLLDILCKLYEEIILPEAVIHEFGTRLTKNRLVQLQQMPTCE